MKNWSSILNLLIPFCLGITLAYYFSPIIDLKWMLVITILLAIIAVQVAAQNITKHISRTSSLSIIMLFFLLGIIGFQLNKNVNYQKHFSNEQFAYLEGEITDFHHTKESKYARLTVKVEKGFENETGENCIGNALIYADTNELPHLKVGQTVFFPNRLEKITNKGNPGEFNATLYWNNLKIYHIAFLEGFDVQVVHKKIVQASVFERCQSYFSHQLEKVLSGPELAIGKALLLGDKGDISHDLMDAFSGAGAMHLLSVSGLHIGIFIWVLTQLIHLIYPKINRIFEVILLLVIVWTYAGITGFSPSVSRASLMFSFLLAAKLSGRSYSPMRILLISAFCLLVYNPSYIFDIGFQLSYLAMVGIFLFYKPIYNLIIVRNKLLEKCWEATAIGIAAQLTTLPLTLYYFHQFPNYFLLTNIGLMLFSVVVLSLGVTYLGISSVLYLNWLIGLLLTYSITFLVQFIGFIYQLPYAVSKGIQVDIWEIPLYFILLFGLTFPWEKYRKQLIFFFVTCFGGVLILKNNNYVNTNYLHPQCWVLNDSKPIVYFKYQGQGILLAKTKSPEKLDYTIKNISSYFGGKTQTILLTKHNSIAHLSSIKTDIKNETNGWLISGKLNAFYLTGDEISPTQLNAKTLIIGNWVPITLIEEIKLKRKKINLETYVLAENGAVNLSENLR